MPQQTSFEAIPHDVLYLVFREFVMKRDLIHSCTFVCKRWRALTFPYIFSSLKLLAKTDDDPDTSGLQINRYVDELIRDPFFPSIQHITSHLTLKWGRNSGNPIEFDFIDFIPSFSSLHSLTLVGRVCRHLPAAHASARGAIKLSSLAIEGHIRCNDNERRFPRSYEYHAASALCDLLSLFGALQSLKLRKFSDAYLSFDKNVPFKWQHWTLPCPRSLVLDQILPDTGFFQAAPLMKHVQNLDIAAAGVDYKASLPVIVAACGPLRKLSITADSFDDEFRVHSVARPVIEPVYNSASLASLKVLVLCIRAKENGSDPQGAVATAAARVRMFAASIASLDCIDIRLGLSPVGLVDAAARCRILAEFLIVFQEGAARFRDLEDALLDCVDAGGATHVRLKLDLRPCISCFSTAL
ncbi:hypothetical protein PsYK624_107060 [Phanerochaete sordida]|uniref:F-box domain-containing protein n=1 Tax=Phanerochaete sordida TaxID=48140 RepID=A0A9P3GGJ1_9APHY|nr:hypothetical protein PsYK624_107060 [Phanerochaete sordida]